MYRYCTPAVKFIAVFVCFVVVYLQFGHHGTKTKDYVIVFDCTQAYNERVFVFYNVTMLVEDEQKHWLSSYAAI